MPVAPSGISGAVLQALKDMIASTTAWQSWTGAEDAEEGAESVFLIAESAADLPAVYCVLYPSRNNFSYEARGFFNGSGEVKAMFFAEIDPDNLGNEADEYWAFSNPMDALIEELGNGSESDGALMLRGVERDEAQRSDPEMSEQDGDFYVCAVTFMYGAAG